MFAGYTPVAVEDFGESNGGRQLIMLHDDGFVVNWQLGTNWERRSSNPTVDASDASGLAAIEASFGVDVTPLILTAIETAGSVALNQDSAPVICKLRPLFIWIYANNHQHVCWVYTCRR